MKINLRKANALQIAINDAIKGLELTYMVNVNEFQDSASVIDAAAAKLVTNVGRRTALLDALYEMRKATAVVNNGYNIDAKLADLARIEKDIQFYGSFAKAEVRTEQAVIDGRLEKMRTRTEDAYSMRYQEAVTTSVFTTEDVDNNRAMVQSLKKQKQKIQDELLEANIRNFIVITDKTAAVLTAENLI